MEPTDKQGEPSALHGGSEDDWRLIAGSIDHELASSSGSSTPSTEDGRSHDNGSACGQVDGLDESTAALDSDSDKVVSSFSSDGDVESFSSGSECQDSFADSRDEASVEPSGSSLSHGSMVEVADTEVLNSEAKMDLPSDDLLAQDQGAGTESDTGSSIEEALVEEPSVGDTAMISTGSDSSEPSTSAAQGDAKLRGEAFDTENDKPALISESDNFRAENDEIRSDAELSNLEAETDAEAECDAANDKLAPSTGTGDSYEEGESNDTITSIGQESSRSGKSSSPRATNAHCDPANSGKQGNVTDVSRCFPRLSLVDKLKTLDQDGLQRNYAALACRIYKTSPVGDSPRLQVAVIDYSGQILLNKRIIYNTIDSGDDSNLTESELLKSKKDLEEVSSQVRRIAQDVVAVVGVFINTDLRTLNLTGCGITTINPRHLPNYVDPRRVLESRDHLIGMLSLICGVSAFKLAGASMSEFRLFQRELEAANKILDWRKSESDADEVSVLRRRFTDVRLEGTSQALDRSVSSRGASPGHTAGLQSSEDGRRSPNVDVVKVDGEPAATQPPRIDGTEARSTPIPTSNTSAAKVNSSGTLEAVLPERQICNAGATDSSSPHSQTDHANEVVAAQNDLEQDTMEKLSIQQSGERHNATPPVAPNLEGDSRDNNSDSGYVIVDKVASQPSTSASPSRTRSEGPEGDAKKEEKPMFKYLREQYRALALLEDDYTCSGLTHWPVMNALKKSESPGMCTEDVALDCTWVFKNKRKYPVRICVVSGTGYLLMDTFVEPPEGRINYKEQWSGITEEVLDIARDAGRMKSRMEAFSQMHNYIRGARVVVGYRLLRDWDVLRLHGKIWSFIDLAVLPTMQKYPGLRGALKQECDVVTQECRTAHDSLEDAAASMLLYKQLYSQIMEQSEGKTHSSPFQEFATGC